MKNKSFKFYSTLILIFGLIAYLFQTALVMDILNVIFPIIEKERGWTRGELNAVAAIGPIAATIIGVALASLILKWGPKICTIGAITIMAIGAVGMGIATDIKIFAISMSIVQIVAGVILISIPALMANWYHVKRGTVLGIITIGAPLSTALFTPVASIMVRTVGYNMTFIITAAIFFILGVGLAIIIPEKPENIGLFPDGALAPPPAAKSVLTESKWTLIKIFSKKETWVLTLSWGAVYLMMTAIMSQMIPRLLDQGIALPIALGLLSAGAILGMPMSYLWGRLDDKISTPKVSGIFLLFYAIAGISMIYASSDRMFFAFLAAFCIAATTGGMPNLVPSSIMWVFGKEEYVNVHRWLNAIHNLFRSAAFVLMGIIFTTFGSYTNAYIIFIPLALVASIPLFLMNTSFDPLNKVNLIKEGILKVEPGKIVEVADVVVGK